MKNTQTKKFVVSYSIFSFHFSRLLASCERPLSYISVESLCRFIGSWTVLLLTVSLDLLLEEDLSTGSGATVRLQSQEDLKGAQLSTRKGKTERR